MPIRLLTTGCHASDASFPVQGALFPLVDEADDEDGQEHHHGQEADQPDLA